MNRFLKRLMDIACSSFALLVLSPLLIASAIIIKLSSKGPVFYKASRAGIDGKPFYMYKFRSMHIEKNAVEKSFIADSDRIFAFGGFMRKSKIDELPQLINILKGDMSIVGPRPASTANVDELYVGEYKNIQRVKPGLTSYASLFDYKFGELFISDNDRYIREILPVRLDLELYYTRVWNIFKDIGLIANTVVVILQIVFGKKTFRYTALESRFVEEAAAKKECLEVG
ncbi:MAG: sugar transferase [Clostridia bacterium]|nr:sugar transferase [Oscillospiraceae bacterium]MBQ7960089.1 sugar transferase [Clostridia bacterium]